MSWPWRTAALQSGPPFPLPGSPAGPAGARPAHRLISNWDPSCRSVLEQNGLTPYLDPILVSSEVGVEKPDRRIFEKALELSGEDPRECLYVGDNYYDDGVGALKWGWRSAS